MQIYLIYQVYNLKALKTHIDAILNVHTVTSLYWPHKQIKYVQDILRNKIWIPSPYFIIMLHFLFVKALYETLTCTPTSFFTLSCPRLQPRPGSPDSSLMLPEKVTALPLQLYMGLSPRNTRVTIQTPTFLPWVPTTLTSGWGWSTKAWLAGTPC